jgi:AraC-like DNA-binding protein
MTTLTELKSRLHQLARNFRIGFTPELYAAAAVEIQPAGGPYYWDGMKSHVDYNDPFFLFQYTLDGLGYYEEAGQRYALPAGTAFATIVPSEHRYFVPSTGSSWHFFWLIIRHQYVVNRMKVLREHMPPVLESHPDSPLAVAALTLLNSLFVRAAVGDRFTEEELIFKFMLECERHHHEQTYSELSEQEAFLSPIRTYIMQSIHRPVSVEEIADLYNLSRSHFSLRFRSIVGVPPAQFILRIRLSEAVTRLLETNAPLEQIATETGFADANHFNKVFKTHYHLTPGQFRKQMRR